VRYITTGALALLALTGTAPLAAQAPTIQAKAPGFFAGLGVGPGLFRLSCPTICVGDRYWGWSGNARAGISVGKQWLIGLEATAWRDTRRPEDVEPIKQSMWLVGPVAYLYPTPSKKLNLKLSIGALKYSQSDPDDVDNDNDNDNFSATAVGAALGVAYDLPIADRLHLSPFFTFVGSTGGDLTRGDGQVISEEPNFSLIQLGVSLVYR
jgi:hypothetical protein